MRLLSKFAITTAVRELRRASAIFLIAVFGAGFAGAQTSPTTTSNSESIFMKISENGNGQNVLVLHGGGGAGTMMGLSAHIAEYAHVITPTHPGWDGTPRAKSIGNIAALADAYVHYLNEHDLKNVILVGSSLGGWIGAEIALRDTAHHVSGLVIINGVGVNVKDHPITNITGFSPQELAKVAFHDPAKFDAGAPPPTPERIAMMKANGAATVLFSSDTYGYDPTLLARLKSVHVPTLVLWGESDHVVDKEYGQAYAAAIPGAQF
jgi:pimeloyl-ACP methyl ester carboxylesterase